MDFLKKVVNATEKAVKTTETMIKKRSIQPLLCPLDEDLVGDSGSAFLHGYLLVNVYEARDLPDMESWIAKLYDKKDVTDAFVDVILGNARVAKTKIIDNDLNPEWNEFYRVEVCHQATYLTFDVRDKDHAYTEKIGLVNIECDKLKTGQVIEGWFPIETSSGSQNGEIRLCIQFVDFKQQGQSYDVDCYFSPSDGNYVKLYQDAHCLQGLPQFNQLSIFANEDPNFINYQPSSYFQDLRVALEEATQLICITGWAVYDKLHLLRGPQNDGQTLGEILVRKSNEGVAVYVMVWSEKSSGEIVGEKGVMGTHDMETFHFFEDTKVCCALAPRELDTINELTDFLQNEFASGMYTHHQKTVILDAPAFDNQSGKRRLKAFVGGLDLQDGRWDTPEHPLFETILNEHLGDFRNKSAKTVPPEQGPRQPWHDIHCELNGPIAHDVFQNFFERWCRQGTKYGRLDPIDPSRIDIMDSCAVPHPYHWRCQIFRSITSDSAVFEPEKTKVLNAKKGRLVDASIAQAYVQMIRNADNFIYIENQYFMGSAYAWLSDTDTNCHHIIPAEIAQRIVEKIYAGERFVAYIVIPMFPEGDPTSGPIQEILYWQYKTMEMMYHRIGQALIRTGNTETHPTDWLIFLCPGKRELPGEYLERLAPPEDPMAKIFRDSLRFPIYVHSKMMIVDDKYIIIGSANINQRSMAGTRDTEIAMGGFQPELSSNGDVRRFRLSLWAEHFKFSEPIFLHPTTLECVRRVKEMVSYNWTQYMCQQNTVGHLLPYPLNVMPDGKLEYIEGISNFPDFGSSAKIMGKSNPMIPMKITT